MIHLMLSSTCVSVSFESLPQLMSQRALMSCRSTSSWASLGACLIWNSLIIICEYFPYQRPFLDSFDSFMTSLCEMTVWSHEFNGTSPHYITLIKYRSLSSFCQINSVIKLVNESWFLASKFSSLFQGTHCKEERIQCKTSLYSLRNVP